MSKVIRISDDLLEKINEFIENDKKIDELLYESFHGSDDNFIYTTGNINGDDVNAWLRYIVAMAIGYQNNTLGKK